ncbi:hypothetical protein KQX54_017251 [Cotesia glomerata]|uniref:Uncharacterized protein n=1 Tax=Cotesia glomerata TaxID=32391 RepID=A0AAV7IFW0_COTGL|nr:hypothetical protein KQX54_017251 [Cotesia glomerata]
MLAVAEVVAVFGLYIYIYIPKQVDLRLCVTQSSAELAIGLYDNFTGYIVRSLEEANSSKTLMYWWAVDGASGSGSGSAGDADTGGTSAGPSKTLDIASVARITRGRIMPICSLQLLSLLTTGFISGYLLRQAAKSLLSQSRGGRGVALSVFTYTRSHEYEQQENNIKKKIKSKFLWVLRERERERARRNKDELCTPVHDSRVYRKIRGNIKSKVADKTPRPLYSPEYV